MRKFLIAALLMLVPVSAMAGWNIKQNADGSTSWVNENGDTLPVGGFGALVVTLTDLSTAATRYIVSPRPGRIKKVYGVAEDSSFGSGSNASTIRIMRQITDAVNQFTPVSVLAGEMTIPTANAVDVTSVDVVENADNTVAAGQLIAIVTDGASTGAVPGTITIVIE